MRKILIDARGVGRSYPIEDSGKIGYVLPPMVREPNEEEEKKYTDAHKYTVRGFRTHYEFIDWAVVSQVWNELRLGIYDWSEVSEDFVKVPWTILVEPD